MPDGEKGLSVSANQICKSEEKQRPQRELIIDAVLNVGAILWCTTEGESCCTIPRDGHLERYRIRSGEFRRVALNLYGDAHPVLSGTGQLRAGTVSDQAMREAINGLDAQAFRSEVRASGVRVLRVADDIVLDLGNSAWTNVRISAGTWMIEPAADVGLLRSAGMMPLPMPCQPGPGTLDRLRNILNISCDTILRLIVAWLLAVLFPTGPYPLLAVDGEQGSGKSTICKMLRRLVDPNVADLRRPPRDERDVLVSAKASRIVAFDNMSAISSEMADVLCRLATGAGLGERRLFTNDEEYIVAITRPILLNGIPSLLARGDLADRSIAITVPPIPDDDRRPETDIWRDFEAIAPELLGLLLNGLATALLRLPNLRLEWLPRMADFARLACAAAPAFGWTEEQMLDALETNRAASVAGVIEADLVAGAVRDFLTDRVEWNGTATELLMQLGIGTSEDVRHDRAWPRHPNQLSTALKRAAPALRRIGLVIGTDREGGTGTRRIHLRRIEKSSSQSSQSSQPAEEPSGCNPSPCNDCDSCDDCDNGNTQANTDHLDCDEVIL